MFKAFLLILCFLVGTVVVAGQERTPQPRPFSPDVQRIFDYIRVMTPEQRVLLRESTLVWLEKRRASERGIPTQDQHSFTLAPATGTLGVGGFPDLTPDPNLLKYGPLGPDVKYGPMGPIGEGQGSQQSANAQTSPGSILNLPKGFTHPLEGLTKDLDAAKWSWKELNLSLGAADRAIGALSQVQLQIAASNQSLLSRLANNTPDLTARAAAHKGASSDPCENSQPSPSVRCVDAAAGRLFVRSDPKGFYVGSLYPGEHFRVRAVRYIPEDRHGNLVCYFYGDAFGNVQEKGVWVNCEGLEPRAKTAPKPPRAEVHTQYHIAGPINPKDGIFSTREYLEKRFDVKILFPETEDGGNSLVLAVVKPEKGSTQLWGNYDPQKRFPFVDPLHITISANDPPDRLKVRYVSNDGTYAVVNYDIGIDPKTGREIRRWGVVSMQDINILRPQP